MPQKSGPSASSWGSEASPRLVVLQLRPPTAGMGLGGRAAVHLLGSDALLLRESVQPWVLAGPRNHSAGRDVALEHNTATQSQLSKTFPSSDLQWRWHCKRGIRAFYNSCRGRRCQTWLSPTWACSPVWMPCSAAWALRSAIPPSQPHGGLERRPCSAGESERTRATRRPMPGSCSDDRAWKVGGGGTEAQGPAMQV